MSFFDRSDSPSRLEVATAELEAISNAFSNIVQSCHNKCFSTRYLEADPNKGELACVDRCVAKYFEANKVVQRVSYQGAKSLTGASTGS